MKSRRHLLILTLLIASIAVWTVPAALQAEDVETQEVEALAEEMKEGSWQDPSAGPLSKLAIHGFLSQAYAKAADRPVLGIPTGGTTDYRTAALQIRYDVSDRHHFVMQFDHERNGASPTQNLGDDVEMDWIYYQQDFGERGSVRVGKIPIPFGLYNEIRDVGTILPFYRPPSSLYGEGSFSNETIDGVVLSFGTSATAAWSLDTDLFFGGWTSFDQEGSETRVNDALGLQLWLNTPAPGLRFGIAAREYEQDLTGLSSEEILSSVELELSRFVIRGEIQDLDFDGGYLESFYVQAGVALTEKLWLNVQVEDSELAFSLPVFPPPPIFGPPTLQQFTFDLTDDLAFGLSYAIRPDLVLKLESHKLEGLVADDIPIEQFFANQTVDSDYIILSLSTSF